MTSRSPIDSGSNKRAEEDGRSSGSGAKLDPFRSKFPLKKRAAHFVLDQQAQQQPQTPTKRHKAEASNPNTLNAKYQAALQRIVELETAPNGGKTTSPSFPPQVGVISEDLVAARLSQLKQGNLSEDLARLQQLRPAYHRVGVMSEELVAARLRQLKHGSLFAAAKPLLATPQPYAAQVGGISEELVAARLRQLKQLQSLASLPPAAAAAAVLPPRAAVPVPVAAKPVPAPRKKEDETKPAATITSFRPICPTTGIDNSRVVQQQARTSKKKQQPQNDDAILKFARLIY